MNDYRFLEMRVDSLGRKKMTQGELAKELNIERNRIQQLETSPKVIPKEEELRAYCEYFNTTSDYLLGIRNTKSLNENIAMINRITGLSDDSINTLKKIKGLWSKKERNTLNYIMKDTDLFIDFLKWLSIYVNNEYIIPLAYDKEKGQFPCNNPLNSVVLGKKTKDNKENDGFETIGISIDILESHAMLKMQEIINTWKKSK